MRFAKGHGTENDFVILPDPDGELDLTAALVAALCDRRAGIGADGVLRVVRTLCPEVARPGGEAEWFMDYRNADGCMAEMCGNGVARLRPLPRRARAGRPRASSTWRPGRGVRTRPHRARRRRHRRHGHARVAAAAASPTVSGQRVSSGVHVDMGNPHLACAIGDLVVRLDLTRPARLRPEVFPSGVNIELVSTRSGRSRVVMRVYERGSARPAPAAPARSPPPSRPRAARGDHRHADGRGPRRHRLRHAHRARPAT